MQSYSIMQLKWRVKWIIFLSAIIVWGSLFILIFRRRNKSLCPRAMSSRGSMLDSRTCLATKQLSTPSDPGGDTLPRKDIDAQDIEAAWEACPPTLPSQNSAIDPNINAGDTKPMPNKNIDFMSMNIVPVTNSRAQNTVPANKLAPVRTVASTVPRPPPRRKADPEVDLEIHKEFSRTGAHIDRNKNTGQETLFCWTGYNIMWNHVL